MGSNDTYWRKKISHIKRYFHTHIILKHLHLVISNNEDLEGTPKILILIWDNHNFVNCFEYN